MLFQFFQLLSLKVTDVVPSPEYFPLVTISFRVDELLMVWHIEVGFKWRECVRVLLVVAWVVRISRVWMLNGLPQLLVVLLECEALPIQVIRLICWPWLKNLHFYVFLYVPNFK